MRNGRAPARVVATFIAALLAFAPGLNAAAAVVRAPVLEPVGVPLTGAAAVSAAPNLAAPALSAPALSAASVLAAAVAPAPSPSIAAVNPAAPAASAALRVAAALPPALAGPDHSAGTAKAEAGRAFDLSAARPAAADGAVLGAESGRSAALAPASAPSSAVKAVRIPAYRPTMKARARSWGPKALIIASAAGAAWLLHSLGLPPALAAPLAFLTGSLQSGPSPSLVAKFLEKAAKAAPAGSVLSHDAAARIGGELALDTEQLQEVLTTLLQQGEIGMQDNRTMVRYSFAGRVRFGAADPGEGQADRAALDAVRLLNTGSAMDHAKGLALADRALGIYDVAEHRIGMRLDQRAEAAALRSNLALEHITDLFRAHKSAVELRRAAGDAFRVKRVAELDEALEWLKTAHYARGYVPTMPRALHAKMLAILGDITPRDETGGQGADVVDAYVAAVDLLEKYDPFYFQEGPARASGEAGVESGYADLIRDGGAAGTRVTEAQQKAAAEAAGIDADAGRRLLTKLAAAGWVVIRDNGAVLRTSLPARAEKTPADDPLKAVHDSALSAVKKLNSTDVLDHLRAVDRLEKAAAKYGELGRARPQQDVPYTETNVFFANAVLECAGDALRILERALRESLSGERAVAYGHMKRDDLGKTLTEVQSSLEWLSGAYYAADRRQDMPAEQAEKMRVLLDLRAFREVVKDRIGGDMEIVRGIRLTREFLARNAAGGGSAPAIVEDFPETAGGYRPLAKRDYPNLFEYGSDLTQKAVEGGMKPMIGRKAEIRQMIKTLLRVEKNNPLVIGEKGVGKTALINGLAQLIAEGKIPELRGKNVIKIDLNKVVAGTTLRGQFEQRMQGIIEEARKSEGRVILFIDEIHMIVGAGDSDKATDAAQILKESLADGSVSLIGATTMDEFRRIEKDGALMRRFNPVKLLPPSKDEAEAIVEGVKPIYEKKHAVTIALETVKAAVALAARYVTDRHLPDSALDLMDDASAEVELKASEAKKRGEEPTRAVTPEDIAREISLRTGIPAGKLNEDKKTALKELPARMKGQVIGQDEAVEKVAEAVQQGETGYRDPKQPIASFVFLGPTGVGKTELARALAKIKFGSEKNMLRLDMSEYQEKHSVSRLISAPPGYVGHDEGGQLTESVRRNPYQVILLDEIEKAHPDVFDVLLQVLEDGRLTDGQGRTVDFSNTIIIMTSNIGGSLTGEEAEAAKPRRPIGFVTHEETPAEQATATGDSRRDHYLKAFKAKYRPEFVNRVGEDRVIVFNELTEKAKLSQILDLRLAALEAQLKDKGLKVSLTDVAREVILNKALAQSKYGARPIKQIVDRELNRALKDAELDGRIADGDRVLVDWSDAEARFVADKAR